MKQLTQIITESVSRTRLRNAIYKEWHKQNLGGRLWRDDYWEGVSAARELIASVFDKLKFDGQLILDPVDGGYRKSSDGMSQWKQYEVEIDDADGKTILAGTLNCHAAGSTHDPFDAYDMTLMIDNA